ncbi:MAG: trypsin-like serine protease [Anaerolineae bacterium]|nr:trypsin-like serine protease [Anaerolineae bacterium]
MKSPRILLSLIRFSIILIVVSILLSTSSVLFTYPTLAQEISNPGMPVEEDEHIESPLEGVEYEPMPLPEWVPLLNVPNGEESYLVTYELNTKTETILAKPQLPLSSEKLFDFSPGSPVPDSLNTTPPRLPDSFSDLARIYNPEDYPWRTAVKMFFDVGFNSYVCSGTLIDPKHIITAGHCVYDHDEGQWVENVVIVPAYENGWAPYGYATGVTLYSWVGWTTYQNWDWDMGYVRLDRPVGALVGWLGYGYNNYDPFFTSGIYSFHNPGYPAVAPYDGLYMYYWLGSYDYTSGDHILYISKRSYGGQSGSGAYYKDNDDNRCVYAVLSHGRTDIGHTGQTRITSDKFYSIQNKITENTPSSIDLIPLNVRVSPSAVVSGNSLSGMDYIIHNYSSSTWSGSVTIKKYLSSNNNISTGDILIGSGSYSGSLGPKGSRRINSNWGTIPASTPPGTYWIGIILDISDDDVNNNDTDGFDAVQVTIPAFVYMPLITRN